MTDWKSITDAPKNGKEFWLGWNCFPNGMGVVPRRGHWDVGSRQWILHWEDRGSSDGDTPIPFDPQPDFYCEGYEPDAPTMSEEMLTVPFVPHPVMWTGLAREIIMWCKMGNPTGAQLYQHLERLLIEPPYWLKENISNESYVPSKGTIAACVYMAMLSDYTREQLKRENDRPTFLEGGPFPYERKEV